MQVQNTLSVRLWDLKANACRWPSGGPWERAEFFCGAPTEPGCSWCSEHYSRAFNKASPASRAREFKQTLRLAQS